jgi:1-aminocyclopropane-1-carboxylate deaminase/D-cysteine desulfhydrase-like pyridoxal-dependent ACC family enzyme
MEALVQFEDRVKNGSTCYKNSGIVLLSRLMGAEIEFYPKGEDEAGADVALNRKAAQLRSSGRRTYIMHLSEAYSPLGALGYVDVANELLDQNKEFDLFVAASGSGATHAGLLAGLRGSGSKAVVFGCCVRRTAGLQGPRIDRVLEQLADLCSPANNVISRDIRVWTGR